MLKKYIQSKSYTKRLEICTGMKNIFGLGMFAGMIYAVMIANASENGAITDLQFLIHTIICLIATMSCLVLSYNLQIIENMLEHQIKEKNESYERN